MTMRIATTLMLGAVLLAGAGANAQTASDASKDGFRPVPAVPALKAADTRTAAAQPAPAVTHKGAAAANATAPASDAPPTADAAPSAASAADAAPTADAAAADTPAATTDGFVPAVGPAKASAGKDGAVKEAKAATIDATSEEANNDTDHIVATVNDESISDFEVRQRVALYMALQGIKQQLTAEQKTRIRNQILDVLEAEKLQLQEAVKKKITVSPVEVDRRVNAMMQDYRFTIEQLRQNLKEAGTTEDALRAQITASLAWQKAVQDEYGDQVNITPEMVNVELQRYAESAHKPHFRVLEIFLPVENPEQNEKVKKDAEEVARQIKSGSPFPVVARQFSQHPTAATGGDMGWVSEGQLAPELNAKLNKMEPGDISEPIRSTGGWYIIGLRERQEPMGTKIEEVRTGAPDNGTLHLARLLFPINPHGPKAEVDQVMNVARQIQERYMGCGQLEDLHKQMNGTVYMDLGTQKLSELAPQISEGLKNSKPGEAAAPFTSDAGIELIGRCDKRVEVKTAYVMPTRQQVEDQLFQNQISTLARRYLRDLKRGANIQVRDDTKPDALIR